MDCSPPGSSVHGIFQARVLEWVAIAFSRGSSRPRDGSQVSCNCRQMLYHLSHQGSHQEIKKKAKKKKKRYRIEEPWIIWGFRLSESGSPHAVHHLCVRCDKKLATEGGGLRRKGLLRSETCKQLERTNDCQGRDTTAQGDPAGMGSGE